MAQIMKVVEKHVHTFKPESDSNRQCKCQKFTAHHVPSGLSTMIAKRLPRDTCESNQKMDWLLSHASGGILK